MIFCSVRENVQINDVKSEITLKMHSKLDINLFHLYQFTLLCISYSTLCLPCYRKYSQSVRKTRRCYTNSLNCGRHIFFSLFVLANMHGIIYLVKIFMWLTMDNTSCQDKCVHHENIFIYIHLVILGLQVANHGLLHESLKFSWYTQEPVHIGCRGVSQYQENTTEPLLCSHLLTATSIWWLVI